MTPDSRMRVVTIAEVAMLVGVLVAGLLIGWYVARRAPDGAMQQGPGRSGQEVTDTRADVVGDVQVPEVGDSVPPGVAAPSSVSVAAPGIDAKKRTFEIGFDGTAFSPNQVIVRAGDTTSIRFTTTAGSCAFVQPDFGLSANFTSAKSQLIEITPDRNMSGRYTFFCSDKGGPDAGPVGYLVVASQ